MKAAEKQKVYDLLKKASGWVYGYTRPEFKNPLSFSEEENQELNQNKPLQEKPEAPIQASTIQTENKNNTAENHGMTIEEVNAKILRCTRCQLARTRTNVVPGMGVSNPLVLVVGEGPGQDEDLQGLPFVGKAGILLDKMLAAINLDRKTNCYIANIVKCRPPQNRDPLPEEQSACSSFLEAQIKVLKPKMILCMGRIAGQKLLDTTTPVGQLRGNFYEYQGIPLMVTYHPSALLRNEELKRPAWEDLKKFRAKLSEITGNEF